MPIKTVKHFTGLASNISHSCFQVTDNFPVRALQYYMTCLLTSFSNSSSNSFTSFSENHQTHALTFKNQHFNKIKKMKTSIPMCFNNSEDPAMYILLNKV